MELQELIHEIVREIANECACGEYVCDTTLIGDYGVDVDSPIGLAIEDEVNKRLNHKYNLREVFKK